MDNSANLNDNLWIQLEIPGLFEQLEHSLDSISGDEVKKNIVPTKLEILNSNKFMRSYEEAMAFEEALAELAKNPKNEHLRPLHLVLDDRCEQHEVMYILVHFLDYFNLNERLQAFINVVPQMIVNAKEWTEILHYRILNNDSARTRYKEILQSANPQSRDVIFNLLHEIAANESPPLSSRAELVLTEGATMAN